MRSIGDQIKDCRSWCQPLGWEVVRVLTDADRSASQWSRKEREGFDEALQLIESGKIDGFVTWEPSRAGRDLEIYLQLRAACREAGVLYLTQGRVFDFARSYDSFMLRFEFLRAEADANTMRERQLRTVRLLAENGRPHGRVPYGYRRTYDPLTGRLIGQEPHPHTGPLVRHMARQILDGVPLTSIANQMQDQGEATPQGSRSGQPSSSWTDTHVGDGEFQVLAEAVCARAEAAGTPVVDRRDGHAQVASEFANVEQGFETPKIVCCAAFGIHTEQVRSRCHTDRQQPEKTSA